MGKVKGEKEQVKSETAVQIWSVAEEEGALEEIASSMARWNGKGLLKGLKCNRINK